jgi:hypothetical protein
MMTLTIVMIVMAPGTHHQLPLDVPTPEASGSGTGGTCSITAASGSTSSVTCDRVRASAVQGA